MTYYKLATSYCKTEEEVKAFDKEFETVLEGSLEEFKEGVGLFGEI